MGRYVPPLRDVMFALHEMLQVETRLRSLAQRADIEAATIDAVLDLGDKSCSEVRR
jgi:hypothetical protein